MGVQLRIGQAVHRPGSGVDEFRPGHVARGAILVHASHADARFHLRFHLAHRLIDRCPERIQNALVAAHGVQQRNRLRHREREIVTHGPLRARSHRQRHPGPWIEVVAQPLEGEFVHRPNESKPGRAFAAPGANYFLAFAVVIGGRVVFFGGRPTILLCDADHALF